MLNLGSALTCAGKSENVSTPINLSHAFSAQTISVVLGASETMRSGILASVNFRPTLSVIAMPAGAVVRATVGALVGAIVGASVAALVGALVEGTFVAATVGAARVEAVVGVAACVAAVVGCVACAGAFVGWGCGTGGALHAASATKIVMQTTMNESQLLARSIKHSFENCWTMLCQELA